MDVMNREIPYIALLVNTVVSLSRRMAITIESIVLTIAILNQGLVIAMMNRTDFKNEKLYQTTMSIARQMLKNKIISKEEYQQIDTIITNKYNPTLGTLFANIDLK